MKIVFQGDSITHGGRINSDWDFNHILGHGYVFNIAGEVGARYPEKDYIFINRGISGNRIVDLFARWKEDTINLKPDLLNILIGVNDLLREENDKSTSNKVFERTYRILIEDLKGELPDTKIVLCEPFALDTSNHKLSAETKGDLEIKQKLVREISEKYSAVFIPLQQVLAEASAKKCAEYWLWDGVHPTAAGHYLIAQQWISKLIN
jgi:lysophospholipase L1-like esterase